MLEFAVAGLPALRGGESGQVRKEAATANEQVPGVRLATFAFRTNVVWPLTTKTQPEFLAK